MPSLRSDGPLPVSEALRRFVRGDAGLQALYAIGVAIGADGAAVSVPALDAEELPLSDLAHGLLQRLTAGIDLRTWARVVLALSDVQFIEAETADEETLLDGVWTAAAGEPIPEAALLIACRLDTTA